jgi:hypothetical protein
LKPEVSYVVKIKTRSAAGCDTESQASCCIFERFKAHDLPIGRTRPAQAKPINAPSPFHDRGIGPFFARRPSGISKFARDSETETAGEKKKKTSAK